MTRKFFGTDGIRGITNRFPMTADVAMRTGMAAGRHFLRGDHRHRVVIGKDTRLSGYMVESAMVAGFTSVGMDVVLVGPMPTPAIAMLTKSMRADLGVMISASHNPFHDNGIKLFGPDGFKLSDDVEMEIETRMENGLESALARPANLGRAKRLDDARGRYIEFAKSTFPSQLRLDGFKVVVDCANGAAYQVAPIIFQELGADVFPIGVEPNGFNINDKVGSTSPRAMCQKVLEVGADFGVALDGDADRLIFCDEKGQLIDGDQLMAMIVSSWKHAETLRGDALVTTVMSNLGLEHFVKGLGLELERTKVGDRYVVERMRNKGINVGGEQSGHIILSDFSTTGDGIIAALQVLAVIASTGKKASEACHLFEPFPQLLQNVRFGANDPLKKPEIIKAIQEGEKRLGDRGRLVIRKSGTEPLIRVMAEGEDETIIKEIVGEIVGLVEDAA